MSWAKLVTPDYQSRPAQEVKTPSTAGSYYSPRHGASSKPRSSRSAPSHTDEPTPEVHPVSSQTEDLCNALGPELQLFQTAQTSSFVDLPPTNQEAVLPFTPRGLANRHNTCFLNSVVQAMLACRDVRLVFGRILAAVKSTCPEALTDPAFSHSAPCLMGFLRFCDSYTGTHEEPSPTESGVASSGEQRAGVDATQAVTQRQPLSRNQRRRRRRKQVRSMSEATGTGNPAVIPPRHSTVRSPMFPTDLIDVLPLFQRNAKGRQEDAQEYFTFLLDALHREVLSLVATHSKGVVQQSHNAGGWSVQGRKSTDTDDTDTWHEVGSGNRMRVIQAEVDFQASPVSSVFGGRLRIAVDKKGTRARDSVSFQPFYSLPLDVAHVEPASLQGALDAFMASGSISGLRIGVGKGKHVTQREVRASQRHTFDAGKLPRVLVFHLKRFEMSSHPGRAAKIGRKVTFPVVLNLLPHHVSGPVIPPRQTAAGAGACTGAGSGSLDCDLYHLRSIVVHHGAQAHGGHYTAYVRCTAEAKDSVEERSATKERDQWFHIDDQKITPVSEKTVSTQQAYLLFYEVKRSNAAV